jgi:hypothetical protein
MTFKLRAYECASCGSRTQMLRWDTDPAPSCDCGQALHETGLSWAPTRGVVDDTVDGHWCETLGHEPVWIESKSQLRREAEKRGLINVVRREDSYYAKQRKMHDERLRDTGAAS